MMILIFVMAIAIALKTRSINGLMSIVPNLASSQGRGVEVRVTKKKTKIKTDGLDSDRHSL